jgi:teichuronic acid biosynthesis glycosyltransferase TuaG
MITPCLKGAANLAQASASEQAQSVGDWEMLVNDDGSTDGSDTLANALSQADARIVPLRTQGRTGAAATRNLGLSSARGQFIAFLDSDDWWNAQKLERQLAALSASGAVFCISPYQVCRSDGAPLRLQPAHGPLNLARYLAKRCVVGCLTVLLDRDRLGPFQFREHLRQAEDFVLWVELLRRCEARGLATVVTDVPVAHYRIHAGGQSRGKLQHARAHWHAYFHELALPRHRAATYFLSYVVNGLRDRVSRVASDSVAR